MTETNRTRTFTWGDPMIGAKSMAGLSGSEYLQAIMDGSIPGPPIADLMDMALVEIETGRAVFHGKPGEFHYNPIGSVHGGFAATLLDSAMGCAILTLAQKGGGFTTLELHVNYLRPITVETGMVICEGSVIHSGRRIATAEGRVTGTDGKLYAHGTTTCAVFTPET